MSLFGKRKDEEGSQVGAPRGVRVQTPREHAPPAPAPAATQQRAYTPAPPAAPAVARFGINEAVALLQSVPMDADGTATLVIRRTLEAVGISIADVLTDGERRANHLEREMEHLASEADSLERRAQETRARMDQLQIELTAVNVVRAKFDEASLQDVAIEATVSVRP